MLHLLDIRYQVEERNLARITTSGPSVVVANHPFGIVEGLILVAVLEPVRPDSKLVANAVLGGLGELRGSLILVNPFETPDALRENLPGLREALRWLSRGGLLPRRLMCLEVGCRRATGPTPSKATSSG
jgi:putative hemolysin